MHKPIPKSVLSGLILLLMSCSAMATTYKLVFPIEDLRPKTWTATSAVTSDWTVSGSPYSCGAWSPNPLTVYNGEAFEQTRTCSQDYERNQALRESELSSGEIRIASTSTQTNTDTITQSQYNIGMLDPWLTTTSTYTGWANVGAPNYSSWSPTPSTQTVNFTQTRNYTQNQERYEQKREQNDLTNVYRNIGPPIRHTQVISGTETRTVAVTASIWANSAAVYACSVWSPGASTQTSNFTQARSCSQDQNRTWTYKAGTTTLHTRPENQTVTMDQSRVVSISVSAWSDSGAVHSCSAWSPGASTQTSSYTQSRSCSQSQNRTWTYKAGTTTIHTRPEYQTVTRNQSRTIAVTVSGWSNSGAAYYCSTWSPATSTVNSGQTFWQSRSCTQNQVRTWSYKAGASTIHTRAQNQTVSAPQSRVATGTKSVAIPGTWSYIGSVFDPEASTYPKPTGLKAYQTSSFDGDWCASVGSFVVQNGMFGYLLYECK